MTFFDVIGLSPDEAKKVPSDELIRKIYEREKKINTRLASGSLPVQERTELTAERDSLADMLRIAQTYDPYKDTHAPLAPLSGNDLKTAKGNKAKHEKVFTDERTRALEKFVGLIKKLTSAGEMNIKKARIRRIANEMGLEAGVAEKAFTNAGFTVENPKPEADTFIKESHISNLNTYIAELIDFFNKDTGMKPAGYEKIVTAYDFVAVITLFSGAGTPGTAADLAQRRQTSTSKLLGYCQQILSKMTATSGYAPICRNIAQLCVTQLFKDDDTRCRYDNTIKAGKLNEEVLSVVREMPEDVKKDPFFAELIISRIRKEFPDEDEAISLYNSYSGLPRESYYEKQSSDVSIACKCGQINIFPDMRTAQRSNCVCGQKLFITCPSCGKLVVNSMDYCFCGYYIPGFRFFEQYKRETANALRQRNILRAEEQLDNTRGAKPASESIDDLERQVRALRDEINRELAELESFIDHNDLAGANAKLIVIRSRYPGTDMRVYETRITNMQKSRKDNMEYADVQLRKLVMLTQKKDKVQLLMQILARLPGYQPAIDRLNSPELRPDIVLDVKAIYDYSAGRTSISWRQNQSDISVLYTVVRKEGKAPGNINDGTIIEKKTEKLTVTDEAKLVNGVDYYYAVFATRQKNVSDAAVCISPVRVLPGLVQDPTFSISGEYVNFNWDSVEGCQKTLIERLEKSTWVKIGEYATKYARVKHTAAMGGLLYRFSTRWQIGGTWVSGNGPKVISVVVVSRPSPVSVTFQSIGSGRFRAAWMGMGDGNIEFYEVSKTYPANNEVDASSSIGRKLKSEPVSSRNCNIDIGINRVIKIQPFITYGTKLISCESSTLNTLEPVNPQWDDAVMNNGTVKIEVRNVSAYAVVYMVIRKSTASDRVTPAERQEAVRVNVNKQQSVTLETSNLEEGKLDILIQAETTDGYLSPVEKDLFDNTPKGILVYDLKWNDSFLTGHNLVVTVENVNRYNKDEEVKLVLVRKQDHSGMMESAYKQAMMVKIAEFTFSGKSASFTVPDEELERVVMRNGTYVKLYLADRSGLKYFLQPKPKNGQRLRCPRAY